MQAPRDSYLYCRLLFEAMGKIRWQILVDEDLSKWYDDAIEDRKYGSRSQAGELALRRMREEVEK